MNPLLWIAAAVRLEAAGMQTCWLADGRLAQVLLLEGRTLLREHEQDVLPSLVRRSSLGFRNGMVRSKGGPPRPGVWRRGLCSSKAVGWPVVGLGLSLSVRVLPHLPSSRGKLLPWVAASWLPRLCGCLLRRTPSGMRQFTVSVLMARLWWEQLRTRQLRRLPWHRMLVLSLVSLCLYLCLSKCWWARL